MADEQKATGIRTVEKEIKGGDHAGKKASVQYNFGASLQEAVEMYGEEVIYSYYVAKAVIVVQAVVKRALVAGKDPQSIVDEHKLGVAAVRVKKSRVASTKDNIQEASLEEIREIQAALKERMASLQSK